MKIAKELIKNLRNCPLGMGGWSEFEKICVEIFNYLFVPPLSLPKIQPRTYSEIDRRDAVYPNRNFDSNCIWGQIYKELKARLVLIEFKNYDKTDIGKEEINQTRNYLTNPMGNLAIIICSKKPNEAAYVKRNTIFSQEGKVILFITKEQLVEMIFIKERGEDPADLIMDLIECFYLQHE
jgi:hypothetical protein